MLGVGGEEVEGRDVQTELLGLGELSETRAQGNEVLASAVGGLDKCE